MTAQKHMAISRSLLLAAGFALLVSVLRVLLSFASTSYVDEPFNPAHAPYDNNHIANYYYQHGITVTGVQIDSLGIVVKQDSVFLNIRDSVHSGSGFLTITFTDSTHPGGVNRFGLRNIGPQDLLFSINDTFTTNAGILEAGDYWATENVKVKKVYIHRPSADSLSFWANGERW